MTITSNSSEHMESQGTTVEIKYLGPGEFSATYLDERLGRFIEIFDIDPAHSFVDADNAMKIRYFARASKKRRKKKKDSSNLSEAALKKLASLAPDEMQLIEKLFALDKECALSNTFARSCLSYVREWLSHSGSRFSSPLSARQWMTLKRISYDL
jgi:hypothetical protein